MMAGMKNLMAAMGVLTMVAGFILGLYAMFGLGAGWLGFAYMIAGILGSFVPLALHEVLDRLEGVQYQIDNVHNLVTQRRS